VNTHEVRECSKSVRHNITNAVLKFKWVGNAYLAKNQTSTFVGEFRVFLVRRCSNATFERMRAIHAATAGKNYGGDSKSRRRAASFSAASALG
jgi:hypothetical protein